MRFDVTKIWFGSITLNYTFRGRENNGVVFSYIFSRRLLLPELKWVVFIYDRVFPHTARFDFHKNLSKLRLD